MRIFILIMLFLGSNLNSTAYQAGVPELGVFYYPGWSKNIKFARFKDPWAPIRSYPNRLPLSGEYEDSDTRVLARQVREMKDAGLKFVVFDWYAGASGESRQMQSVNAYLKLRDRGVKFSIMYANHDNFLSSEADWDKIVRKWISNYFLDYRYYRVNRSPIVFIFSAESLESRARSFGRSTSYLIYRAKMLGRKSGIGNIIFLAGTQAESHMTRGGAKAAGYDAVFAYNVDTGAYALNRPISGYSRRAALYEIAWHRYLVNSNLPVVLPLTAGWDRSPWGGSRNSKSDNSRSTPEQFQRHVSDGLRLIQKQNTELGRIGVICCWNEYGEGSVIEPTLEFKSGHIQAVASALKATK